MLPNHRLLARAFHRVPVTISKAAVSVTVTVTGTPSTHPYRSVSARRLSNTSRSHKWEGSKAGDHMANETDPENVHHEAAGEGKAERAKGEGSSGTSEKAGMKGESDLNKKAASENKEAPKPVIGMNDERGGKGH